MRLTRMVLTTALAVVLMALGGCGDGDDSGAEGDGGLGVGEDAGDGDDASDALGGGAGGSGTITFDGQTYEFESVVCGRSVEGSDGREALNFSAISADLSLSTDGFGDSSQVHVLVGGDQYTASVGEDGELTRDESGASGDLEFANVAGGDPMQGSFEVTYDCP